MSTPGEGGVPPAPARLPVFLVDRQMDAPERHPLARGTALVLARRAPGKETANEDAVMLLEIDPDRAVLAVADGVGGMPGGEQASMLALQEIARALDAAPRDGSSLRTVILDGIENANRALIESSAGYTTLAVVEVRERRVRCYHAGDSLILLTGQRGRLRMQTIPHSPVGYAVESGLLPEDEAMTHDQRHLIDNALGTPDLRIEIGPAVELADFDTLLLASDGLADNLTTAEIVERVRKGRLDAAAARLLEDCRRRMEQPEEGAPSKPDDLSFVLFRLARTVRGATPAA